MSTILFTLAVVAYVLLTFAVADIVKAAWKHYNVGTETHPEPYGIREALRLAIVEVCYERPRALHQSRLAAVARDQENRADAIEAAMLRHPANYRARQACIAAHPSGQSRTHLRLLDNTPA